MLRPAKIPNPAVNERGGIEGEGFPAGIKLAAFDPGSFERIGGCVFQNVDADIPNFLGLARGEVDIPLAIDVMNFRGPDVSAHWTGRVFTPDGFGFRLW